jgi:hypothetical protein
MASTPGHHQRLELLGDILLVHKGMGGRITGVLMKVMLGEPLTIAVLSTDWPAGVTEGTRLHVRGELRNESLPHKKATHFCEAQHITVVPRRQKGGSHA